MQEKPLSAADKGHVNTNGPEKAPPYVLLPGDPDRVVTMTQQWDGIRNASDRALMPPQVWTLARQAKCAVGTYMGAPIGAWSTGIGGPSAEFTLHEILDKGGETFIRVGTTGAIQPDIAVGDIIINDANIRLDGTSNLYVPDQFPAAASYEVTLALVQACENLGLRYHVGTGCTCGSFFTGRKALPLPPSAACTASVSACAPWWSPSAAPANGTKIPKRRRRPAWPAPRPSASWRAGTTPRKKPGSHTTFLLYNEINGQRTVLSSVSNLR